MTTTPQTADHHRFAVTRDPDGEAVVHLDGVDISKHLAGYELRESANDLPVVVLHLSKRATQDATFDGLAHVVVGEAAIEAGDFLSAIDPAALEQAALNDPATDAGENLTATMLRILGEWSRGVRS